MRIGKTTQYRSTSVFASAYDTSGVLTVTASTHLITVTGTVSTISGGSDGQIVTLIPANGVVVSVVNGTLVLGGDVTLSGSNSLTLQKWSGVWYHVSRLGVVGLQGNQGDNGIGGVQGAQGNPGLVGPLALGFTGNTGDQGPAGVQGATGTDGNQGPAGVQGVQGPQGFDGNQGPQGNPCIP